MEQVSIDRFWARVDKTDDDGCWLWTAGQTGGCGVFCWTDAAGRYHQKRAHLVSYELCKGKLPARRRAVHTCNVTLCVNPSHLLLPTSAPKSKRVYAVPDKEERAHKRGARHPHSKLTEEDIIQMRWEHASGMTITAIARKHRVSGCSASKIINGKAWQHVVQAE